MLLVNTDCRSLHSGSSQDSFQDATLREMRSLALAHDRALADRTAVLYLNHVARDAAEASATTLDGFIPGAETLRIASLLGTKAFIASGGCCVVAEQHRSTVESFARYAIAQGLVEEDALSYTVFVNDPLQYRATLAYIAEQCKHVLFYMENNGARQLARDSGISDSGPLSPDGLDVVDTLRHKSHFRNVVEHLVQGELFRYPRVCIQPASIDTARRFHLARELERASSYYSSAQSSEIPVLFMQAVKGDGGQGNVPIFVKENGSFYFEDFSGNPISIPHGPNRFEALVDAIVSLGVESEITPFLDIEASYSYSVFAPREEGKALVIRKRQRLERVGGEMSYRGSEINVIGSTEDLDLTARELEVVETFTEHVRQLGYHGPFDIDCIRYRDRDGVVQASVSEANMRRDAPSLVFSVLFRDDKLAKPLLQNELSVFTDDHFILDSSITHFVNNGLGTADGGRLFGTEFLANLLKENNIPLYDANNPDSTEGVIFISPPLELSGSLGISVAVVAETDQARDSIVEALQRLLNKDPE